MKRIVQILAAAALLIALSLTAFATANGSTKVQTRGDLNGDGACTLSDVLGIFRQTLAGGQHSSQYAADIDGNGSVNLRDALLLLQTCLQPSDPLPSRTLTYLSKAAYTEKTEAGFLGQLVGMISGYEFAQTSDGRQYVGMPDDWYAICAGPYGAENSHWHHTVKRIYNNSSKLWEIWLDDDFSVDIVNQYAIADSFAETNAFSTRYIGQAWTKYDVYDMGGGNRYAGAYYLLNKYGYLTP
ncbi:MAG: dockerin type I repeat-containing protein, partial [Clostridia bacterium]|nr:dockerin type I repeat-containing protein [Clostridia bacterium]